GGARPESMRSGPGADRPVGRGAALRRKCARHPTVTVVGRRCAGLPVTVSQLAIAPVKGMRLQRSTQIQLGRHGVTDDRAFLIVDDDCKLLQTSRNPGLLRIEPSRPPPPHPPPPPPPPPP